MISPTTNNNNNNSNTNNSNPHLTNKLYSAPVLEKSTFQLNSNRTTFDLKTNSNTQINNESPNNTTNTNTQPYIPKSYTTCKLMKRFQFKYFSNFQSFFIISSFISSSKSNTKT